jgi:riboflavin biosynthesis pyrimidine reductase
VLTFPAWPYEIAVFVLSTSIKELPDNLKDKATILSMQPAELLDHLSAKGFSNIYVDGANVIQGFLKEDLIDELIISTVPIIIGEGIALFRGLTRDLRFRHIRCEVQSNGLVRNYYDRKRSEQVDIQVKPNKKSYE